MVPNVLEEASGGSNLPKEKRMMTEVENDG